MTSNGSSAQFSRTPWRLSIYPLGDSQIFLLRIGSKQSPAKKHWWKMHSYQSIYFRWSLCPPIFVTKSTQIDPTYSSITHVTPFNEYFQSTICSDNERIYFLDMQCHANPELTRVRNVTHKWSIPCPKLQRPATWFPVAKTSHSIDSASNQTRRILSYVDFNSQYQYQLHRIALPLVVRYFDWSGTVKPQNDTNTSHKSVGLWRQLDDKSHHLWYFLYEWKWC